MSSVLTIMPIYLVTMNIVTFVVFGLDKQRAKLAEWRISERTLLLLAFAGGSVGALAGMALFHHKTRKAKFQIGVPLALVLHIAIAVWVIVGHPLS